MGEVIEVAEAIFHVEIRHAARVDGVAERDVGVDLHAFFRVEAHLLI